MILHNMLSNFDTVHTSVKLYNQQRMP